MSLRDGERLAIDQQDIDDHLASGGLLRAVPEGIVIMSDAGAAQQRATWTDVSARVAQRRADRAAARSQALTRVRAVLGNGVNDQILGDLRVLLR